MTIREPADGRLSIALRPSPRLLGTQLALHLAALTGLWTAALPVWASAALSAALLTSAVTVVYRYDGRGGGFIKRLELDRNGVWRARRGDGRWQSLTLSGYRFHPALLVLNFRRRGRRRALVICADAADASIRRRLRQRLLQPEQLLDSDDIN